MAKNVSDLNNSLNNKFASKSHGNHVPTTQTADNAKFLRNDNTWQTVTPANIGAATSSQLTTTNNNIGTLSNLQTSNKNNLVAAINEVFQSGVSAKQKLVDALNANGLNCSTSDSWDALLDNIVGKEEEVSLSTYIIQNNALNPSYSFYNIGTRWWHNTTNGLYSQNISGTTYAHITTNQKINFNNYHTIKVTAKNTGATSKGFKLWVSDSLLNRTNTYDNTPNYSTDYGILDTSYYTQSFDISSWNCEGYLAITRYVWNTHSFYISDIELIGEATVNTSVLGGAGFNIISRPTLPATGKENQICIITNSPVEKYIVSSVDSDFSDLPSDTILLQMRHEPSTNNYTLSANGITVKYYFSLCLQNKTTLASYVYKNGQWTDLTPARIYFIKDLVLVPGTDLGNIYNVNPPYVRFVANSGLYFYATNYNTCYCTVTSANKINMTAYNKVHIVAVINKSGSSASDIQRIHLYASNNYYNTCNTSYSALEVFKTAAQNFNTTVKASKPANFYIQEFDFDITSWSGQYYFGITFTGSNSYDASMYIQELYFY